jgi:tRNA-splicing ligase RtcB
MTTLIRKQDFRRLSPYLWELPASFRLDMRVPVWLFADDELPERSR